jgi:hypothetical protein
MTRFLFLCLSLCAALQLSARRVVHVVVALCDNVNQGIVPVPAAIGNGQDPGKNLYWGCGYGVRTHFNKSTSWKKVVSLVPSEPHILERIVWKHVSEDVYLVADAYDGAYIRRTITDLLDYAAGHRPVEIVVNGTTLYAGGDSDLIAYVGHDGLMEFPPPVIAPPEMPNERDVIILACVSRSYFKEPLKSTGASPLLWTTGFMAPEAYTLRDALDGWVAGETDAAIAERAAQAYNTYQKCGINGARRLLVTGW